MRFRLVVLSDSSEQRRLGSRRRVAHLHEPTKQRAFHVIQAAMQRRQSQIGVIQGGQTQPSDVLDELCTSVPPRSGNQSGSSTGEELWPMVIGVRATTTTPQRRESAWTANACSRVLCASLTRVAISAITELAFSNSPPLRSTTTPTG